MCILNTTFSVIRKLNLPLEKTIFSPAFPSLKCPCGDVHRQTYFFAECMYPIHLEPVFCAVKVDISLCIVLLCLPEISNCVCSVQCIDWECFKHSGTRLLKKNINSEAMRDVTVFCKILCVKMRMLEIHVKHITLHNAF